MTSLYYLANRYNGLVVGTGNKTELAIGYFTKYGDGGVDVLPLGDLDKTAVRGLARALGVPEAVISKAPSAGLWEGQTDEAEIGVTYDELDRALASIAGEESKEPILTRTRWTASRRSLRHQSTSAEPFRCFGGIRSTSSRGSDRSLLVSVGSGALGCTVLVEKFASSIRKPW